MKLLADAAADLGLITEEEEELDDLELLAADAVEVPFRLTDDVALALLSLPLSEEVLAAAVCSSVLTLASFVFTGLMGRSKMR